MTHHWVLDDFADAQHRDAHWTVFTDRVMGGVSVARAQIEQVEGRRALRLRGTVSLEQNGGFVQMARAATASSDPGAPAALDAAGAHGLSLDVCGAPGSYYVHLRTGHTRAPWQHYRAPLTVLPHWCTVVVPWSAFEPRGLDTALDVRTLLRIGVVGAGAAFAADVAIARLAVS
jgi:hypothetical protein